MKIGELSRATGTNIETIRYYERAGILPQAECTGANYRNYREDDVERLRFIRHARRSSSCAGDKRTGVISRQVGMRHGIIYCRSGRHEKQSALRERKPAFEISPDRPERRLAGRQLQVG